MITFACEICGKSLSTTDDKAGRKAKCPGCGEMLTVPHADTMDIAPDDAAASESETSSSTTVCPMCGETIPARSKKCQFCGEALAESIASGPRVVEFSDVFATAWERFKERMGMAVVGQLLVGVVTIVSMVPAFGVFMAILILAEQSRQEPDPLQFLWLLPCGLFTMAVVFYLTPGMAMFYLGLGRGEDVGVGLLFGGGKYFVKSTLCGLAFGMVFALGLLAFVIPGIIFGLRYWPYLYVIVDEDPPGLDCFSRSAELTQGNWGSILLLGISGFVINAAASFCNILQLFTQPFNTMLFVTAYLKMSGQVR